MEQTGVCRICYEGDGELRRPCRCSGSVAHVHEACLQQWLTTRETNSRCELCHTRFRFRYTQPYEDIRSLDWICMLNMGASVVLHASGALLFGTALAALFPIPLLALFLWKNAPRSPFQRYISFVTRAYKMFVGGFCITWALVLLLNNPYAFIAVQTLMPVLFHFHLETLERMNANRPRTLMDMEEI